MPVTSPVPPDPWPHTISASGFGLVSASTRLQNGRSTQLATRLLRHGVDDRLETLVDLADFSPLLGGHPGLWITPEPTTRVTTL
jgi:hypothetical protein